MQSNPFVYGRVDRPEDITAYGDVLAECFPMFFHGEVRRSWPWSEDPEHFRLLRQGDRVVAGLVAVPLGQWFGGRAVPSWAIRLVGVDLESRSLGVASHLMGEMLREARERGVALSSLYPATQPVYRSVGYEQSGSNQLLSLPVGAARLRDRSLQLHRVALADARDLLEPLYTARARRTSGHLERNAWMWQRVFEPRLLPEARVFVATGNAGPEGYLVYSMPPTDGPQHGYDLFLSDLVAGTAAAARRLMAHLGEHHSLGNTVRWRGTIDAPECVVLPQQKVRVEDSMTWMLRIVDVRAALERRGYAPQVKGRLSFEVRDELLPENEGRWILEVADGRARVEPGGDGDLRFDIRGLAPVYSGHLTPQDVCVAGLADGSREALSMAAHLFTGPRCWMPDFF